ncbi:CIS tube protein [Parerythrobacter aestuarii]|uniref:CIS tube protein n=1 Tax=Parerythrobacter aestuarii TaxID=3020909 RepID=UPI0024DE536B|nr:hypothetical protein [Parerythrobacter aestuarii]
MSDDAGQGVNVVHAKLKPVTDQDGAQLSEADKDAAAIEVQFNPETLDISLSNNFKESSGDSPTQLVDEASAQLSLELQFDTTDTGVDVRQRTHEVAKFLKPLDITREVERGDPLPPPMVVEFDWGAIVFQGYMDSYSETLEFFSHDGVPLRAKVSISLTQQERSFDPRQKKDSEGNDAGPYSNDAVNNDPFASGAVEQSVDPNAPMDNAAAAANGVEDPRQPNVDKVALPEKSGKLGRAAAAFAQAGASLGAGLGGGLSAGIGGGIGGGISAGAGIGIGASAGAGFGVSGGVGFGASAGAGFGVSAGAGFGASAGASLGVSAGASFGASAGASIGGGLSAGAGFTAGGTTGAFSGLSTKPPKLELKPVKLPTVTVAKTATTGSASLGGALKVESGGSLSAKVGTSITFGEG